MSGDVANGVETTVADHIVSHFWEHTYLLWFDDQLTPHLRLSKPPTATELARAKWGIGGQGVGLWDGKVRAGNSRRPDLRTAVAIDTSRKFLFLAVGNNISPRLMLQKLAELGARDGMLLDGGRSSSMAIGKGARGVKAGTVIGGWQPVATQFGVRARRVGYPELVSLDGTTAHRRQKVDEFASDGGRAHRFRCGSVSIDESAEKVENSLQSPLFADLTRMVTGALFEGRV